MSDFDDINELLDCRRRFLERRVFVGRERDLDDLLESARAELARNADKLILHAVLALQEDGTWNDFFLVEQDRFHHFDDRRTRSVPGARANELGDFEPTSGGPR